MVAKRKKKRAASKERSVQILPNRIIVRDDRLVVIVRSRDVDWHSGASIKRAHVGRGKALFAKPDGGITIGNKVPGPKG
jgi:hypothetical protein